jgi:hypothetical protein
LIAHKKQQQKGFRKEDFRVQVDGAGRLTVRGQRAADGGNRHVRFHKVFQLPPASNLEDISGRFDAGVLSLTVPKRPAAAEDVTSNNQTKEEEDDKAKKAEPPRKEDMDKPKEDVNKAETKKPQQEEEAKKKPQQVDAKKKTEPQGCKAGHAPPALPRKEEDKPKSPETKQQPDTEEGLLERVKRHAAQEEKEEAGRERKQISRSSAGGGWKERVAEELQGLATSEWAEGMLETVKKNKEVIAVAATAFSLGFFVSRKLCCRNN